MEMWLTTLLLVLLASINHVFTFPDGAPIEACETLSPRLGHKVVSQPVELSPYTLVQYRKQYKPGTLVEVELIQKSGHRTLPFKGFLVQALDSESLQMIGRFLPGTGLQMLPECAAVTHNDTRLKDSVSFLWMAPSKLHGNVIFRATIVVDKKFYFENLFSRYRL